MAASFIASGFNKSTSISQSKAGVGGKLLSDRIPYFGSVEFTMIGYMRLVDWLYSELIHYK